jgi:hypothetical protein
MTDIINFPTKKYGVDYHRAEMERCGAEYVDYLYSDLGIAWKTTKGVLFTYEASGKWHHEWNDYGGKTRGPPAQFGNWFAGSS